MDSTKGMHKIARALPNIVPPDICRAPAAGALQISDSGEGRWTLHSAVDLGVPTPVISAALFERFNSRRLGEYGNKILNGMRYMFGGHHVR